MSTFPSHGIVMVVQQVSPGHGLAGVGWTLTEERVRMATPP